MNFPNLLPLSPLDPCTIPLKGKLSVRLYSDCRPNFLETGALQKGLVLMLDGKELIEEGVGFGVPVIKYADKTYFSGKATVKVQPNGSGYVLTKVFVLDTVSVKKLGHANYINDRLYSFFRKTFQLLYLRHRRLNPLFNRIMETRDMLGVKTEFRAVKPRGIVTVTYDCQPSSISIHADLSNLTLNGCREVLLLNEQGSSTFQTYSDSSGIRLQGDMIGAWDTVTANTASFLGLRGQLMFSIQKIAGSSLFRGWEHTQRRFSWAGISYSLKPHNGHFYYSIDLACN